MTSGCTICGAFGTIKWTIDNLQVAVVADLCAKHSEPLMQIIAAAGPVPAEQLGDSDIPRRVGRKRGMEPLAWTPPS
jgi:hypothetical protein